MKQKYIAFDRLDGDIKFCDTKEDSLAWCKKAMEYYECDNDCIPDEIMYGFIGWAEIKQQSKYIETDSKKNYPCIKCPEETATCSDCEHNIDCKFDGEDTSECCVGTEEWPYSNDFETVGRLELDDAK